MAELYDPAAGKRERLRLAKAEMWLAVAASHAVSDLGTPNAKGEPFGLEADLIRKYGLSMADLRRLGGQIGDELERRAERAGIDQAWPD